MIFDNMQIAEHLAGAVRIPTVSKMNRTPDDIQQFYKLHRYLEDTFPVLHKHLTCTVIDDTNLIYLWKGHGGTARKPLALLAHQDVVAPGNASEWTYPPFDGTIRDNVLWGRGAIDSKSHIILHMTVIEYLLKNNYTPQNDIYLCYGSDEELMLNESGASKIVDYLKENHISLGCAIDEGGGLYPGQMFHFEKDIAFVALAEKGYADFKIQCSAEGGHPGLPQEETAIGKLCRAGTAIEEREVTPHLLNAVKQMMTTLAPYLGTHFAEWLQDSSNDEKLMQLMRSVPSFNVLLYTTTALTMVQGGIQSNVMPETAALTVNCRLLPGDSVASLQKELQNLLPKDTEVSLLHGQDPTPVSSPDTEEFILLQKMIERHYPEKIFSPLVLPGGTDSRFYYPVCGNVYRFSPVDDPEHLFTVHKSDERLNIAALGKAAEFYLDFIKTYSDVF